MQKILIKKRKGPKVSKEELEELGSLEEKKGSKSKLNDE